MAGPELDQWISELGLQEVDDPGIGRPVYRRSFGGKITLSAELEEQIRASLRDARDRRELPRSKLSRLLGLSEQVYVRYEEHLFPRTVGRLIHLCEVLDAAPEEIIAPAAIHLWGETETKADLLLASIEMLRTFDEETLRDVFSFLGRLEGSDQSDHSRNDGASAARRGVMQAREIPNFVNDVIKAGCDICAVGHDKYVLGDFEEQEAAADNLRRLEEKYGDRSFLKLEIVAHLRSLGRYLDPDSAATHWTENTQWP